MTCYRKMMAAFGGSPAKWSKPVIYWWAEKGLEDVMAEAASRWTAVTALNIVHTNKPAAADIVATFGEIDGKNNVLAYAFFPPAAGRPPSPQHGDILVEPVDYHAAPRAGKVEILTHELGHSIGIDHHTSDALSHCLMAPTYSGPRNGKLYSHDIAAAQKLYPLPT